MNPKSVTFSIVAVAALIVLFASGPLVASAQAFPGFHRGFGFGHGFGGFHHGFGFHRGFGFGHGFGFPGWGWGGGWGGGCGGCC